MPVEIGPLITTTPLFHAVSRCFAMETSMSIPVGLTGSGLIFEGSGRTGGFTDAAPRAGGSGADAPAGARTVMTFSGRAAGDWIAQLTAAVRTRMPTTLLRRMDPLAQSTPPKPS